MQEKYKKSTIRFIQDLCPGGVKFRSISTQGEAKLITSQEAFTNEIDNVYFLGGVKEDGDRLRDTDIGKIYYLRFDIDIKKQIQKAFLTEPSRQDILDTIKEIKRIISINQYFDEWKYIVYSGGGCHIYYKNSTGIELNETFTPRVWMYAMKKIYQRYNTIVGEEYLHCDTATCNAARIMRLPGTINQKNGETCEILYEQDKESQLFPLLYPMGIKELKAREQQQNTMEIELQGIKNRMIANGGITNAMYEAINKIPAYIVAQLILPDFPFDGKKNFKNKKGGYTGYYYVPETNSICNGGSRYFDWGTDSSCWNNFSLIKNQFGLESKQVFTWFKDTFKL